jgi:hypothetical protein
MRYLPDPLPLSLALYLRLHPEDDAERPTVVRDGRCGLCGVAVPPDVAAAHVAAHDAALRPAHEIAWWLWLCANGAVRFRNYGTGWLRIGDYQAVPVWG